MKKIINFVLVLFLGFVALAQNTVDISQAIDISTKEISGTLPAKSKVAVATFFSDSKELSNYLSSEVVKKLMQRGSLILIERNEKNMSLVNAEMEYQYSGNVSDDSMVEFGYRLGAQYLVYGAFDQFGGMFQFTIQVANVETAEISYMKSFTVKKTLQLTELFGDSMEMNSAEDYLNAIARCQRKISSIEKDKSKAVQNQTARIYSSYQEQINKITAEEKNPWESKAEYDSRIKEAVNDVVKKRESEISGIEKSVNIKYDNQLKQVEIQKDKLVKDLQNTTFSLTGKSVQVMLGAFDAESKPKNWPVNIKSLDKQISYAYSGKYLVNDADVKSEYQLVEQARKDNNFEGEILYRIIEGGSKNSFEVFVVSVRVFIKSSESAILNESINKSVGILNANRNVSGASSANVTSVKETSPLKQQKTENVSSAENARVIFDFKNEVELAEAFLGAGIQDIHMGGQPIKKSSLNTNELGVSLSILPVKKTIKYSGGLNIGTGDKEMDVLQITVSSPCTICFTGRGSTPESSWTLAKWNSFSVSGRKVYSRKSKNETAEQNWAYKISKSGTYTISACGIIFTSIKILEN